ncbi:Bifunctional protein: zinc-containing alcohol dehydrogenase [Labilithrix luteola]|uniref:Bifunctional protein: zinc-containing alcohol dehydrogenase n=1 Tax=Labilithrix luteola TaxID=1391654 RepID=A0A0K1PVJ8_9BACT|nr:NADP-dependent oxidoreductase [Labilithrix luteola]AKU97149.1 Bifunctional protein: zinc-containing alcohol dehydrogenase [Labilithrix luteola]
MATRKTTTTRKTATRSARGTKTTPRAKVKVASARARAAAPTTMLAAAIDKFGPPSAIRTHEIPIPALGPTDVLIALRAADIGSWDAKIRDGSWANKPARFPLVLGTDGAGVVEKVGTGVRRFDVGDEVWAFSYQNPKGGFYGEYVVVDSDNVGRVPKGLGMLEAGTSGAAALTAQQGVDDILALKKGETVLIVGASGAVGTLAIQFAKRHGVRVIATASGRDATKLVRELGADEVIDARRADAVDKLRKLTPKGLDAAFALASGPSIERLLGLVRAGGRIAYPNGVEPPPRKRAKVEVTSFDGTASRKALDKLDRAVTEAKLRVPIEKTYPLARAAEAHERLEEGHVLGHLALRIRGPGRRAA